MRIFKTLEDAQKVVNQLLDWKDSLSSKDWDLKGKRISNASPSVDPTDYVIKSELTEATSTLKGGFSGTLEMGAAFLVGGNSYTKMTFKDGVLKQVS